MMCRHCERIVEDVEMKPHIHAIMEHAAKRLGAERYFMPITADDLDMSFTLVGKAAEAVVEREKQRAVRHDPCSPLSRAGHRILGRGGAFFD